MGWGILMLLEGEVWYNINGVGAGHTTPHLTSYAKGSRTMANHIVPNPQEESPDPVFVYFISASDATKIGIASDPQRRLLQLQTAHHALLEIILTLKCANREVALSLEKAFKSWYAPLRLMEEWYNVAPSKIASDIRLIERFSRDVLEIRKNATDSEMRNLDRRFQAQHDGTLFPVSLFRDMKKREGVISALRLLADELEGEAMPLRFEEDEYTTLDTGEDA